MPKKRGVPFKRERRGLDELDHNEAADRSIRDSKRIVVDGGTKPCGVFSDCIFCGPRSEDDNRYCTQGLVCGQWTLYVWLSTT